MDTLSIAPTRENNKPSSPPRPKKHYHQYEQLGVYWWEPDDRCVRGDDPRKWCARPWCARHGKTQRIWKMEASSDKRGDAQHLYMATLPYRGYFTRHKIRAARKKLVDWCDYRKLGLIWTLEFVDFAAHLNLTIFSYTQVWVESLRTHWLHCLKTIGHPDPDSVRVSIQPCRDIDEWSAYMFCVFRDYKQFELPPNIGFNGHDFCNVTASLKKNIETALPPRPYHIWSNYEKAEDRHEPL